MPPTGKHYEELVKAAREVLSQEGADVTYCHGCCASDCDHIALAAALESLGGRS